MVAGPSANLLIVLDELDKATKRAQHDPLQPLQGAPEAATARATRDLCVPVTFDASHVSYIATANTLSGVSTPLLSRFEIIHCTQPGPRESLRITRRVWAQSAAKFGVQGRAPRGAFVRLAGLPLRRVVQLVEHAIGRMRSAGRQQVELRDLEATHEARTLH